MQTSIAAQPQVSVRPVFDGNAVLPRIFDWPRLSARLAASPAVVELDPSFFEAKPARSYLRQLDALGLEPQGASARIERSGEGLAITILIRCGSRELEDRWDMTVDVHGIVRGCRSEHSVGLWCFEPGAFSRFFERLLAI
jgi:hypothetical protein